MILLETKQLTRAYGGVIAVSKVDFEVEQGLITGLIGPNGAGKTTLFNNITGLDVPTSGTVHYKGKEITGKSAHSICRMGVARTFQNIRLFKELTVLENVMVGRHFKVGTSPTKGRFGSVLKSFISLGNEEFEMKKEALHWLDFFELGELSDELAKNLPYGHQRELEIARALATEPSLLFLDEPAAGMNPQETEHLMSTIRRIRALGITVVLIEHDMKLVMNICDTITVLNYGQNIAQGTPKEIKRNPLVIEAYLGKEDE
ncbi:MAG: ABC transporter ATP-binding protein [Sphaerochaetaceae bacterium]|jgi:branched-chain amino acid transport system ATP-binding protein|nr:ABC transporter ATP-binding protein [Sphaerochaetaceae bacterium]NLO60850.1 ABC transporter ATP-binding protein [Spirochaetales bacterium]MDD2405558.1 ABC transporter ATP-binding protein [Sphaerochaetaceae bacterium]MDD3671208.1 ABC transporter ATP-binding protein [Sphaerochaetaceae bacterium]MDD4259894.1 ABC transporter ATP-binding protein [Sphaerochaetaceae bacterium]